MKTYKIIIANQQTMETKISGVSAFLVRKLIFLARRLCLSLIKFAGLVTEKKKSLKCFTKHKQSNLNHFQFFSRLKWKKWGLTI